MDFCILTIIENAIIFVFTDKYKQQPTSGEFLRTHFKNILPYYSLQLLIVVLNVSFLKLTYNHSVVHAKYL